MNDNNVLLLNQNIGFSNKNLLHNLRLCLFEENEKNKHRSTHRQIIIVIFPDFHYICIRNIAANLFQGLKSYFLEVRRLFKFWYNTQIPRYQHKVFSKITFNI